MVERAVGVFVQQLKYFPHQEIGYGIRLGLVFFGHRQYDSESGMNKHKDRVEST